MNYQHEPVTDVIPDMQELLQMHYEEVTNHKDVKVFDPDYRQYEVLQEMGMIRCFTARDEGMLVGYFFTFISPHIHYVGCNYGMNDIIFLHPDYRGGTIGHKLIKKAMEDLRDNTDTHMLCIHMKIKYPFRKLLKHLGFEATEENWEIRL